MHYYAIHIAKNITYHMLSAEWQNGRMAEWQNGRMAESKTVRWIGDTMQNGEKWIRRSEGPDTPTVTLYRCRFAVQRLRTLRLHVSGDEWFELYLDGDYVGRGPHIGCPHRWFYQTLDLHVAAGEHVLMAKVFALGEALRPQPVMSAGTGFLCWPEPDDDLYAVIATGVAAWEWKDSSAGWHFSSPGICDQQATAFGPVVRRLGGAQSGNTRWLPVERCNGKRPLFPSEASEPSGRLIAAGRVRHVSGRAPLEIYDESTESAHVGEWSGLLEGDGVRIPPHSRVRVLVDWDDYVVGVVRLTAQASPGATIAMTWTERLMEVVDARACWGCERSRSEISGLRVVGPRDEWHFDDAHEHEVRTPWKRCGRYLEIYVESGEGSMMLSGFGVEDLLPSSPLTAGFESDHALLDAVLPSCRRCLEVGLESTFCDTPYYEQVQWVGDMYPILLSHLAAGEDQGVYRQALRLVAESVQGMALTQARYPHARSSCVILSFSLWYALAVHDYALWRGHADFVRTLMPTARRNLDTFLAKRGESGLYATPPGWNYFDWAPGWKRGEPPQSITGESGPLNLLLALACERVSALEEWLKEPELAQRWARHSRDILAACRSTLFDRERGQFADGEGLDSFSEHAQVLALLHPALEKPERQGIIAALERKPTARFSDAGHGLTPVQPFFSHHLFEALACNGRIDLLFERLEGWRCLLDLDIKTTPETMPGTRSDSHAWSAHPLYHALASVAGIRPGGFGFTSAVIRPQLLDLTACRAEMWTPRGRLTVEYGRNGADVTAPPDLPVRFERPDGGTVEFVGSGRVEWRVT